MRSPTTIVMECSQCGSVFKGNPRSQPVGRNNYCSISCEERRTPLPDSDPSSPNYFLYLQGNPKDLVGKRIDAKALKLIDYSPDWHKKPDDYSRNELVSVNEEEKTLVKRERVFIGEVIYHYSSDNEYLLKREPGSNVMFRIVDESVVLEQLKNDRWMVYDK